MVVVPYRPLYKAGIFLLCLVTITAFSWFTYRYGLREGLETKIEVVNERDEIKEIESDREKIMTMCSFCHGEVQMMGENRQVRSMEMGFCISCHKSKGAPTDCYTCHK